MRCTRHNYEYDYFRGEECPDCSLEQVLKEQTKAHEEAIHKQTQAQIEALEADAARREELHYENIAEQQRLADEAIYEQQRLAQETINEHRNSVAHAWQLQSQAKSNNAIEMLNAGMFEESLTQAREAIGEIGGSGDPSNIIGQLIAAKSLIALKRNDEAIKYFKTQVKLLRTPFYQNDIEIHIDLLESLPQNEDILENFSTVMCQNASNWDDSNRLLYLIKCLNNKKLNSDAKYLAQLCVAKLENCYVAKTHTTIILGLCNNNFNDEAMWAANVSVRNSVQMVKRCFSELDITLNTLVDINYLQQAKQLSESMLSYNNTFFLQLKRQEILYRSRVSFDRHLSDYIKNTSYKNRSKIYSELNFALQLKTSLNNQFISQATESIVKNLLSETYQQWIPGITNEIRDKSLTQVNWDSKMDSIGVIAFISSILCSAFCFPISLILNLIWGIKIYGKYANLQQAKLIAAKLSKVESEEWGKVLKVPIHLGIPNFSHNQTELVLFCVSLGLFAFLVFVQIIRLVIN